MRSVDCLGGGVVAGVDEWAGGEPVGTQFMCPKMVGRVVLVCVAKLVG